MSWSLWCLGPLWVCPGEKEREGGEEGDWLHWAGWPTLAVGSWGRSAPCGIGQLGCWLLRGAGPLYFTSPAVKWRSEDQKKRFYLFTNDEIKFINENICS